MAGVNGDKEPSAQRGCPTVSHRDFIKIAVSQSEPAGPSQARERLEPEIYPLLACQARHRPQGRGLRVHSRAPVCFQRAGLAVCGNLMAAKEAELVMEFSILLAPPLASIAAFWVAGP